MSPTLFFGFAALTTAAVLLTVLILLADASGRVTAGSILTVLARVGPEPSLAAAERHLRAYREARERARMRPEDPALADLESETFGQAVIAVHAMRGHDAERLRLFARLGEGARPCERSSMGARAPSLRPASAGPTDAGSVAGADVTAGRPAPSATPRRGNRAASRRGPAGSLSRRWSEGAPSKGAPTASTGAPSLQRGSAPYPTRPPDAIGIERGDGGPAGANPGALSGPAGLRSALTATPPVGEAGRPDSPGAL